MLMAWADRVKEASKQTNKQIDGRTDRLAEVHTYMHTVRQMDGRTDRQTDR
jgi:hypothetical protein